MAQFYLCENPPMGCKLIRQSSLRLRAIGGLVPPSVFNLPYSCEHQIQFLTLLPCLLLHLVFILLQQQCMVHWQDMAMPSAEGEDSHLAAFLGGPAGAWFAFAESKVREKAIISQLQWFDLLLAAMPEKILVQVMDMVDNVPEDFPYDTLKSRLLETHTLSDQEKLDVLYKSQPLYGRKPSQMLASMLAYCHAGMEQTIMFQYMFLQRLHC
jgi:hypothetical protein